jgi:hypothetical protein
MEGAVLTLSAEGRMKLVTYDPGSGPRAGVLVHEHVVDASALLGSPTTLRDVRALLEVPDRPLDRLRAALDGHRDAGTAERGSAAGTDPPASHGA